MRNLCKSTHIAFTSFTYLLIIAPEQQEKQSVVETDGSEAGLEKKPVTEKDISQSCHIIIVSKT